jgi:hypothetical protein
MIDSKHFLINTLSKEERLSLKQSLLGKTIHIIVDTKYGLFTEHGFPVAIATYNKFKIKEASDFYAEVIAVDPMVTIYEIQ